MSCLKEIVRRAALAPKRIVLPEAGDPRILKAAERLQRERIARPVLVGSSSVVQRAAQAISVDLRGIEIVDPATCDQREDLSRAALAVVEKKGGGSEQAAQLLEQPLYAGAALVSLSHADGLLAGAVHSTAETLRAILRMIGPAASRTLVSSFFLMELARLTPAGEGTLAFADCGLVPSPSAEELAQIALGTAEQFALLTGREPRVALLSFSTKGSAEHESVERVRQALEAIRRLDPSLKVDGELQGDAALIPEIAASKAPGSAVAGSANVLIFPDLNAGNIAYKLVERLAQAQAIGPLLAGVAAAANDLSRGCSVDDIVVAAAVTSLQAR